MDNNPYDNMARAHQGRPLPNPPHNEYVQNGNTGSYPIYAVGGGRQPQYTYNSQPHQNQPMHQQGPPHPGHVYQQTLGPNGVNNVYNEELSPVSGSSPTLGGFDALSPTDEKYAQGGPGHMPQQQRHMMASQGVPGRQLPSPEKPLMHSSTDKVNSGIMVGPSAAGTAGGNVGTQHRNTRARRNKDNGGLYGWLSGATIADSGKDDRHIKLPHLGYLDGAKFLASLLVLNAVFFQAISDENNFSAMQRHSPLYILRSFGLGTFFLLTLSGRSLITPLWDVPLPPTNAQGVPIGPPVAVISWARLSRAMLVRTWRFILPVIIITGIQWGLGANHKTDIAAQVGIQQPYWIMIRNWQGYVTLLFNLFTYYEWDTLAGQTFAGNLWTNPWFFQGGFCAYVVHMMLGNLSSNRYWIYFVLAFFSWCTYNYFFAIIIGVVFADLHAHGVLHRIRTRWPIYYRLALHVLLLAIAFVFEWVNPVRNNVNRWFSVINVQNHPELTICDAVFVFCFMFVIETNGLFQALLGNVVLRVLGKLTAGVYVLTPIIMYAVIPHVAQSLNNNNASTSTITGVSWFVLFLIVLIIAIPFHFFVELPSKLAGELFADCMESRNLFGRRVGDKMNPPP